MDKQPKLTKRHANMIFDWCIAKYGKSKYNRDLPYIEFKKGDYYTEECMAFYDEIESTIFIDKSIVMECKNASKYEIGISNCVAVLTSAAAIGS